MNILPEDAYRGRSIFFIAKSQVSFQIWKETEPELFYYFEKNYKAWKCSLKMTADEKTVLVELEIPAEELSHLEKALKNGTLAMEMDRMHGLDPVLNRKDVKISRFTVTMAPSLPKNKVARQTIESLEQQLLELEIRERSRSIDIRVIMERIQGFQLDIFKRLQDLEKKVEETHDRMELKCQKLERTCARYIHP